MPHFIGRKLKELSTAASGLWYTWTEDRKMNDERDMLGAMVVVVIQGEEGPDHYGAGITIEGDKENRRRMAQRLARRLYQRDPDMAMWFMRTLVECSLDKFRAAFLKWAADNDIPLSDSDMNAGKMGAFNLDEEVGYSIYEAARKHGTTHEEMLAIDHENARFLARWENEHGNG